MWNILFLTFPSYTVNAQVWGSFTSSAAIRSSLPRCIDPELCWKIARAQGARKNCWVAILEMPPPPLLKNCWHHLHLRTYMAVINSNTLQHMNEREQLRWNTNVEALQPHWVWTSLLLSLLFSLSLSISGCSMRLAMGKLPMNETTVDTKRIIFLPLLHCTGSGLWNPVIHPQSSGLGKH